jgi:adenosylhomocysteinase
MTVQTAVLIETLVDLGADVRWASCNIFSTQDTPPPRSAVGRDGTVDARKGIAVFAWKGETLEDYWWCTNEILAWPDGNGPDLIVDDGGDATLLVHKGLEFERAGAVPAFDKDKEPEEWGEILAILRRMQAEDEGRWQRIAKVDPRRQRGDHHGRAPSLPDGEGGNPPVPGDQRQRLGDQEQVRQHLRLPALAGGRHQPRPPTSCSAARSPWCAASARSARAAPNRCAGQGCRVIVTEIDPICALQAAMQGYEVKTLEDVVETADLFVTATGNYDIITADHMARMKDKAIVGNIGHFDNEIDMAGLAKRKGVTRVNIKPQYDEWVFPDGHSV